MMPHSIGAAASPLPNNDSAKHSIGAAASPLPNNDSAKRLKLFLNDAAHLSGSAAGTQPLHGSVDLFGEVAFPEQEIARCQMRPHRIAPNVADDSAEMLLVANQSVVIIFLPDFARGVTR